MTVLESIKQYVETTSILEIETVLAILGIVETDEYKKEKKRELKKLFGIDKEVRTC